MTPRERLARKIEAAILEEKYFSAKIFPNATPIRDIVLPLLPRRRPVKRIRAWALLVQGQFDVDADHVRKDRKQLDRVAASEPGCVVVPVTITYQKPKKGTRK